MKRVVIATLTIFIFLAALVVGQLALTKPAKAQTSLPPPGCYNVKDYGATGNGSTDDTTAINNALAALPSSNGILYFPAGTYIVKAPQAGTSSILHFNKKYARILGDGPGSSTIKVANNCPTYEWLLGPTQYSSDLTGLEICYLTFDHNIANNPIIDEPETLNWPEYTCGTYTGSNISIHDIEVINASSRNNIVVNTWMPPGIVTGSNCTIERITCSNIGDDPNHVYHDASFFYIVMKGYSISDCNLSCASPRVPGGQCAIEAHGTNYTIENNTITNFKDGMNICGIDILAENCFVRNNTITECLRGMDIYSQKNGLHQTGYGIDGLEVSGNTVNIIPFRDGTDIGFANRRCGIALYPGNDLDVNDLAISNNTVILDSYESSEGGYENGNSEGIGGAIGATKLSNSSITGNTVTNFPNCGIRFNCNFDTVAITGNMLTNCGSSKSASVTDQYRTPLTVKAPNTLENVNISGNTLIDNIPVTRIKYFVHLRADTSSTGLVLNGNSYSVTGDKAVFIQHIYVYDNIAQPLITETIASFVPPTHKVQTTSRVIDGSYIWVVGSDGLTWKKTMPSISPKRGPRRTTVTINGSGFGKNRGGSSGDGSDGSYYVTFNGTQASEYPEWSDTEIKAVVPEATALGPAPVVVVVGGAAVNTDNTFTVTPTASSFYFAEGYTGDNFIEYLCIGTPNNTAATANVTYIFSDGTTKDVSYNVPANSRYTVNVNSEVGAGKEVSIRVLSETANLVAERPMYFNYKGVWTGGSEAAGAPSPAKNWYFAEGNTLDGFDQYVTVLNPGGTVANLTFHYMVEGQGEVPVGARVNPNTRATFRTRDQIGSGKNASLYLESDQDVVAERPMYFNYQGLASNNWTGGHDVVGINSPAENWYFAEGTTRSGFEQWLCLQNPGSSDITVNATYQLGPNQGKPVQKSYTVPAKQRLTVPVNVELGTEKDNSVYLSSASDFIAERPMYFNYNGAWDGGHVVPGANNSANTWVFADGYTGDNFNEWLCLQNPGTDTANVDITYYPTSGTPSTKPWTVPPNSRLTINVNDDAGSNLEISTKVSSDKPIIAERPMYFAYRGAWTGGHDVMGFVPSP